MNLLIEFRQYESVWPTLDTVSVYLKWLHLIHLVQLWFETSPQNLRNTLFIALFFLHLKLLFELNTRPLLLHSDSADSVTF